MSPTATAAELTRLRPPEVDAPAWLAEARAAAADWAGAHGLPTRKNEDWKYTDLRELSQWGFAPAGASSTASRPGPALVPGGIRLAFLNGRFAKGASRLEALPEGATVRSLAEALGADPARLAPRYGGEFAEFPHAFAALNAALAEDGAYIELAPGTVVEEPIELAFYADSNEEAVAVSSPRSVVLAGANSRATLVETYSGAAGARYLTNSLTQVVLGEGASILHHKIQDESTDAFHVALVDVRQGRDSTYAAFSFSFGGAIARHEVRVRLDRPGASFSVRGLYVPLTDQLHDNPVLVEHCAPRCTSRQLYKGIADGNGHGVFNGRVVVHNGASGTDASQTNRNLLLSERAELDTRPRLEILDDDVKCSHGAAVGSLDESALFYLRARGIPADTARAMLVRAFAEELVESVELEAVRLRVGELLDARLGSGGARP